MATRLLNSGDLRNYQAIGEDGVLVWQRADAFRASIENSSILGEHYARCLATPRFSSDGTHVDWFVPFQSNRADGDYEVVSWNAASPDEKARALKKFEELEEKFLNFGYNLEARSLSSNDKLFAHFLTGNNKANIVLPAIHYPDESCIYIVNGEPVELSGKDTYIFVDIFTHISFDLQAGKGRAIATVINGRDAQFSEELHEGDQIELYWKEN